MKILSIETATEICGIHFGINGKTIAMKEERIPRQHAQQLPLYYQEIAQHCDFDLVSCDAIAISIGPGSFTGLRIGLSFAKGLASCYSIPIIPVSTLHGMLFPYYNMYKNYHILTLSHGNNLFYQEYDQTLNPLNKPNLINSNNIENAIDNNSNVFQYNCNKVFESIGLEFDPVEVVPSSKHIGDLAYKNFQDWIITEPQQLVPDYISPFKTGRIGS